MDIQGLIKRVRSGVLSIEFELDGQVVASGSGFMARGLLVTNNHVYAGPAGSKVIISWQLDKAPDSREHIKMSITSFKSKLKRGSPESDHDYAILDIDELKGKGLNQFELELHDDRDIGDEVVLMGYPFGSKNLVAHAGYISSFTRSKEAQVIQIDASVNSSNSGGPLISVATGKVIGIVTRKGTGITEKFQELIRVFDVNIKTIAPQLGAMSIGGVDVVQSISASQEQMKIICRQIERSANVGIGYAFGFHELLPDLDGLTT